MSEGVGGIRPLGQRLPLADAAAERLREAILNGSYEQGQRLSDSLIAEELGISRGCVREALKLLQAQGLVVHRPHKGTFVLTLSPEDVSDAHELRVALECHAVRVLARRRSTSDVAALGQVLEKLEEATMSERWLAASEQDREFHELICRLAGSRRLRETFDREVASFLGFFVYDEQVYRPLSKLAPEFRPLLEAIKTGDEDEAAGLIESHVRRATGLLLSSLENGRVSDD